MKDLSNKPHLDLQQFLQEEIGPLEGIIRSYVVRMGLMHNESLQTITLEIINEATVEALAHVESFQEVKQPRAWFLGIAVNMIKRRRATLAKNNRREYSIGTLASDSEAGSEEDFFDKISHLTHAGPEEEVENRAQVDEILSLASPADRTIIHFGR